VQIQKSVLQIQNLSQEVHILKLDNKYMCHLALTMRSYSQPSSVYAIYLRSQLIALLIRALVVGQMCMVDTPNQFITLYKSCEELDKNLLCEAYLFNFAVSNVASWDPNPLVGDPQLISFASFMGNQISWHKAISFFNNTEKVEGLHLRPEPCPRELYEHKGEKL